MQIALKPISWSKSFFSHPHSQPPKNPNDKDSCSTGPTATWCRMPRGYRHNGRYNHEFIRFACAIRYLQMQKTVIKTGNHCCTPSLFQKRYLEGIGSPRLLYGEELVPKLCCCWCCGCCCWYCGVCCCCCCCCCCCGMPYDGGVIA